MKLPGLALGIIFVLGLGVRSAHGEPWLGTRFAQNCAACHAPGRLNRMPADRRCTLSCQGCHVNPNGGGIRNFYGVWNQQRWLRSFYIPQLFTNRPTPAPFKEQLYASRTPSAMGPGASLDNNRAMPSPSGTTAPNGAGTATAGQSPAPAPPPRTGYKVPRTVPAKSEPVDERLYDRSTDNQEKIIATTYEEFLSHVPSDDPYREERGISVTGGGDFRYITTVPLGVSGPQDQRFDNQFRSWLMAVDVGARVRPIREHASLVFETRYLNPPQNRIWDQTFTNEVRVRSAYALFDDFPYNSYLMYGLYRPMFGLFNPDHDSLSNVITGLNQRNVYKSVGVGAAPNVPFFNFNLLTPLTSKNYDQSTGINFNLGARWVTLGASLVLSYWNTTSPDSAGNKLRNQMYSLTGGIALDRFIYDWELTYVNRDFAPGSSNAGTVFTNQFKYRFLSETYLELNLGISNVAMNLNEGASNEAQLGVRSFLFAGSDLEVLFSFRNNKTPAVSQSCSQIQVMTHLFF